MRLKNTAFILIIFFVHMSLRADDITLQNGRTFQNVKSRLHKEQLIIKTAKGKTYRFPIRILKRIKRKPVNWPTPIKIKPEKKKPIVPVKPEPPPANKETKVSTSQTLKRIAFHPNALAAQSLIPGWSGLYWKKYKTLAVFFTFLEAYALYRLWPWLSSSKAAADASSFNSALTVFSALASTSAAPEYARFRLGFMLSYQELTTKVQNPLKQNEIMSFENYQSKRNQQFQGLALMVLADALVTFWLSRTSAPLDKGKQMYATPSLKSGLYLKIPTNKTDNFLAGYSWRF